MLFLAVASSAPAQELEPRTYSNLPVGVNFIAVGYAYSAGNVLLDPSLPLENIDAKLDVVFLRYVRSVAFFGRGGKVKLFVPHASGDWEGVVNGEFRTRDTTGFGDAHVSLEVNFAGAPALGRDEFGAYRQRTIVGAGLRIVVPTGDVNTTKAINLGSNRWTFKPEIGASHAVGKWTLEAAGSVWLFTDNDEFLGELTLAQDPLFVLKLNAVRNFRPGFWVAAGAGFGLGGRTTIDGIPRDTEQRNWRFRVMVAYPLTPAQGVTASLGSGINDGAGTDVDTVTIGYQYAWGGN